MGKLSRSAIIALPLLALAASATASTQHPAPPKGATRTAAWNSDKSDMPADESIIYGRLPNGLRYAIRHNERPQNQVLIRLAFDFGSAGEADDEQGLAHFIEHMAFNGTTNVPEGEMVKMLERLGLAFGADTNASTGFTMTDYRLDLPKADPTLIERALFLMRETASEITFDPAAVDRERGVVIAEMRQRDNFQYQRSRAMSEFLYPGTYLANRSPIGKKEVLETASAEKMKALYRKWYTPDRARIVVVGPIDPVAIEREIERKFGDWKGSIAVLGDVDQCKIDPARKGEAALFTHPQINESLMIQKFFRDPKPGSDFDRDLIDTKIAIATGIVMDRLQRKSRKEDIPYLNGGVGFSMEFCDDYAAAGLSFNGKDGSWEQLMPLAEQIVRQAAEHGFTEQEVTEFLKRYDTSRENWLKQASTRSSGQFANWLASMDDSDAPIVTPEQSLIRWKMMRPFMTREAISAEFAKWFGQLDDPMIFLSTRKGDGIDQAALKTAFTKSRAVAVAAPEARVEQKWAYTDFGSPGKVVSDTRIADLGIRTIRFSNGVMLNLKKTDFEAERVRFLLRIDGGVQIFGKDDVHLADFMNRTFTQGGLGKHDVDDLQSLLAGSTARGDFLVGGENFSSGRSVAPKDLELQMQVTAALLTDPGKREEAVRLYRRGLPEYYSRRDSTPTAALSSNIGRIMSGGDPRFSIIPQEKAEAADFALLDKALGDALSKNAMEISLVGALDEEQAIAIVARTFGALPERRIASVITEEARKTSWSGATGNHDLPHKGEANQLGWQRTWTTTDDSDFRLQQSMDIFASMVRIRLIDELREKLGATYGAGAVSDMSPFYTGRGSFSVSTNGDPKDMAAIEAAVDAVMAEMLAKPAGADLFERARKPTLESYADWKKQNSTWEWITVRAQTDPRRLERFRISEAQFKSITAEEVWQAAKKLLEGKPSYTFRAIPAKAAAAPVAIEGP
jgi:zinc protease